MALPELKGQAMVQVHCHQHAVLEAALEAKLLERMGLEVNVLNSGCCGMAGSFGFEKAHYEVAMKCGERVLLPAVRDASPAALIVANGFSCREQIARATDRQALHLAQVLRMALRAPGAAASEPYPERRQLEVAGLPG